MDGGFSFRGIHSKEFGVFETPETRVLMPIKRRNLINIPGRNTAFVQEDGGWNSRVESIICSYVKQPDINLQRQVREIAGWLQGVGELTFDYEPEMHYNAFLSNAPPTVKHLEYAQFTLEFTINHPFAYETAKNVAFTVTDQQPIELEVDGTIETPCRIIIRNNGTEPITNLTIARRYIQE